MSDAPGPAGSAAGSAGPDEQFVVPVPTQTLPVTPSPHAVQPGWWPPPSGAEPTGSAAAAGTERGVDPLIGQVGVALFWVTVGWWLFFVVRLLGRIVRVGFDQTLVIRTIDDGAEETVAAAVVSVLAALLLLLGRGRAGRSPIGWASLALAVLTVVVTVWRLLP
ncbi:hypothetical protein [Terrabacter terrigena]|uniref:Uncharacterized protein n=1 Tax=Terrabacter terrigena TaxID=574718 RepID=A0ABW3N1N7_9MICO